MTFSLKDMTLEKKLKLMIMSLSSASCAVVCLVLVVLAGRIYRYERISDLRSFAGTLGRNVHAAMLFNIPGDARSVISSVEERDSIIFAGLYDINGNLFAGFQRDPDFLPPERPDFHGYEFIDGRLYFYQPVYREDRILGSICIVDDLETIRWLTVRTIGVFLLILALVLSATYVAASHLQKLISAPLLDFTEKAQTIALKKDYTVRMRHDRQDELGILAAAFNIMLAQIEKQSEELEEANANLEDRVRERTEELKRAQEKLLRSQKLALVGELAGSIAHELRTPLGVLKNAAYYLKMRLSKIVDDDKIMRHLKIIEDEITSSDRIITDVLTFARVKQPVFARENTNSMLKEALKKVPLPDNIKLEMDLAKSLPAVYGDRIQIIQVLCNLIINAAESMPEGGVLGIKTQKVSHFVKLSVSDTGTGISKENMEKIFEPLFSTKVKGTGLGLSTCRTLISLHNGDLEVDSKVGKGSTFSIKLPVLATSEKRSGPQKEQA